MTLPAVRKLILLIQYQCKHQVIDKAKVRLLLRGQASSSYFKQIQLFLRSYFLCSFYEEFYCKL